VRNVQAYRISNAMYLARDFAPLDQSEAGKNWLFSGRLISSKKAHLAIEALSHARRTEGAEAQLLVVGDGPELQYLAEVAARSDIASKVTFIGEALDPDYLSYLYSSAQVHVCPGYAGLNVLQAAWFGVPSVVARDEPHAPEAALGVTLGAVRWSASNDARSFAAAASSIRLTADEKAALSRRARASASIESMVEDMCCALESIGVSRA
jgi:glycosyltransferase involved in cell wall biosynthesis